MDTVQPSTLINHCGDLVNLVHVLSFVQDIGKTIQGNSESRLVPD